ncbi:phospholipase domain-containing protein [Sphingobacterium mizutaii]|uniref:phospholipase domain-containing protein n=1 Tax=Sphingobacterium mizutaii TaxID=1010 RepID=UPI00289C27A0|nr:phospholipase domain-containing protein [Sphingobacterium mizutaii]
MLIASPWSRGGKVCSEVFDHTSTLQFLEYFVNKKFNKNIHFDNIGNWRRTICGNLTSAFSPFNPKEKSISFLNRNPFIESIYSAKFKEDPGNFHEVSDQDIQEALKTGNYSKLMSQQEPGKRIATALPYQLSADLELVGNQKIRINMKADNKLFGNQAAGSPFTVYAPDNYTEKGNKESCRNWSFAVKAGDEIQYEWPIEAFDAGKYRLHLHGPNGFFREFAGSTQDPRIQVKLVDDLKRMTKTPTGNLSLRIKNTTSSPVKIHVRDLSYNKGILLEKSIPANAEENLSINLVASLGWYDFALTVAGKGDFYQRFAGRVETGKESITDPLINRV